MEQDTRTFLEQFEKQFEQFEKQIIGMINSMEKRLEDKIDGYMERSQESSKENTIRHADFRSDIKQLFKQVESIEKSDVSIVLRIQTIEADKKAGKENSKFKWETIIAIGGITVAIIALFYRG